MSRYLTSTSSKSRVLITNENSKNNSSQSPPSQLNPRLRNREVGDSLSSSRVLVRNLAASLFPFLSLSLSPPRLSREANSVPQRRRRNKMNFRIIASVASQRSSNAICSSSNQEEQSFVMVSR